jgi:transcriptional regulator with XRE-family HTH domain
MAKGEGRLKDKDLPPMAEWFKRARLAQMMGQEEFARYVGRGRSAVAMYEKGSPIPADVVAKILTEFPETPAPPSGEEVRKLGVPLSADASPTIMYAGVVPCSTDWGDPLSSEERRPIDHKFTGPNRFLCKVRGDSCYPALMQGDLTIWEVDRDPQVGVIVLAERLNDQACTVKELRYDETRRRHVLVPINPDSSPPEDGDGWTVTARLVGVIRQADGPERTWYWSPGLRAYHLID